MTRNVLTVFTLLLSATLCLLPEHSARAACTPGIPCTDFNIFDNPDAGTDATLNGLKTGLTAPFEGGACDGNFMNQMIGRAYLEASREVIMAQQIIHKPDSVLEYTCFDQILNNAAANAGIFSEQVPDNANNACLITGDNPCTSTTIDFMPDDDELDTALDLFLYENLEAYINGDGNDGGSFTHTFLGEATTIDTDIADLAPGAYNCTHMATIWEIAKCADFGEDDRFRTFADLIDEDPRSIPEACSPSNIASDSIETGDDGTKIDSTSPGFESSDLYDPCPAGGAPEIPVNVVTGEGTGFSNDIIRLAFNCDSESNADQFNEFASIDLMVSQDDLFRGIGTDVVTQQQITCSPPLPTGVPILTYRYTINNADENDFSAGGNSTVIAAGEIHTIERQIRLQYDHICPNPGCYFVPEEIVYTLGTDLPDPPPSGSCEPFDDSGQFVVPFTNIGIAPSPGP